MPATNGQPEVSHRWCRFGRWGWGTALGLALWLIFLSSYYFTDREIFWRDWALWATAVVSRDTQEQIRLAQETITRYQQAVADAQARMDQVELDVQVLSRYRCAE